MEEQVKKTASYQELRAEAKGLGINGHGLKMDELQKAIDVKKSGETTITEKPEALKGPTGISTKEAASIEARLRFEEETRDKIRAERQIITDTASVIAESESLNIPITLPDNPTALDLAKARRTLGMKKKEVKPSPETIGIEAGKRGYYLFNNLEQEDANHTVNLGGKYVIHLIAEQVHVLSDFHVRRWAQCAVRPVYERVATGIAAGPDTVGEAGDKCVRTGSKRRFSFEYLGEAPVDSPFGLVTDEKILDGLLQTT